MAKASLKVASQDDEEDENLKMPSNALKLLYDIKTSDIKVGVAAKKANMEMQQEAKDFLTLSHEN